MFSISISSLRFVQATISKDTYFHFQFFGRSFIYRFVPNFNACIENHIVEENIGMYLCNGTLSHPYKLDILLVPLEEKSLLRKRAFVVCSKDSTFCLGWTSCNKKKIVLKIGINTNFKIIVWLLKNYVCFL